MTGEAEVKYLDGDFRVVRPGAFVRCAVTGVPIPLEELKYWSVELQEAYASPEAVLQRLHAASSAKLAQRRSFASTSVRNASASSTTQRHRQHVRARGERRERRLAGHARVILFGGEQHEPVVLGRASISSARFLGRVAVMVGKGAGARATAMPAARAASRRISPDRRCRRRPAPCGP